MLPHATMNITRVTSFCMEIGQNVDRQGSDISIFGTIIYYIALHATYTYQNVQNDNAYIFCYYSHA